MHYTSADWLVLIGGSLASLYAFHSWRKSRQKLLPLPPGPKGLPLLGNTLDMLCPEIWEAGKRWGEEYGPLVHTESLGTSFIFVNSYDVAVDLFEKRGSNYSSRPISVMIELEGWDWLLGLTPYGDEVRKLRQMMHRHFQSAVVGDYSEMQIRSTHRMLQRLLDHPDKYLEFLQHSVGETILKISYGYQALEENDPLIGLVEKGLESITGAESFFLVNVIPWLRYLPSWFPGAGFQKIAQEARKYSMGMYHDPHESAKKDFIQGTAEPSMSSKLLERNSTEVGEIRDEELIKKVTGVAYVAGADTSVSALYTFLLAMVLYPEVQQRAQDELDRVMGRDALPTFDDRPKLPYIEAIVKESLRWQPIAPCSIAHVVDKDDEYNGYFMPSGAVVFPNIWAILRDPKEYPEPEKFIPERWLPAKGKEPPLDVHKVAFGIGRRICPGRHFASNSVFIGIASVLAVFNISKAHDENGKEITPTAEYTSHLIRHPKPFKYKLTPRSKSVEDLVHHAVESMK